MSDQSVLLSAGPHRKHKVKLCTYTSWKKHGGLSGPMASVFGWGPHLRISSHSEPTRSRPSLTSTHLSNPTLTPVNTALCLPLSPSVSSWLSLSIARGNDSSVWFSQQQSEHWAHKKDHIFYMTQYSLESTLHITLGHLSFGLNHSAHCFHLILLKPQDMLK